VATKPDAAKPEAAKPGAKPEAAKPGADEVKPEKPPKRPFKRKKLFIMVTLALLVLALAGGAAWFFVIKRNKSADGALEATPVHVAPKGPPTYYTMDNMVVNLANPGGEKVAQIGITLELADTNAVEQVRIYLPAIRSGILLLISQRTAEDVLSIEGKGKLAADILQEALRPFEEFEPEAPVKSKKEGVKVKKKMISKNAAGQYPVLAVHFSSFIVQ